jgi:predicted lipoprotein with Yx(FWY)xxD motif
VSKPSMLVPVVCATATAAFILASATMKPTPPVRGTASPPPAAAGSSAPSTTRPPATTPAAPRGKPAGPPVRLSVVRTRIGVVVVGPGGRTLYRFKNDTSKPPKSNCYAGCAIGFPPVIETGPVTLSGIDPKLLGRATRADGKIQLTLHGWPLYRFNGENGPAQLKGEGVRNLWHAFGPTGEPAVESRTPGGGYGG